MCHAPMKDSVTSHAYALKIGIIAKSIANVMEVALISSKDAIASQHALLNAHAFYQKLNAIRIYVSVVKECLIRCLKKDISLSLLYIVAI